MEKYLCLQCGKSRIKRVGEKVYKKKLPKGKIVNVPVCCDHKMEIYNGKK